MAITDNLIVQVKPDSADTFIKNLIDDSNLSANGAGTLTLVNDSGLYGWQVASGARDGTFTGGGLGYEGSGITVAMRVKMATRPASFSQLVVVGMNTNLNNSYGARLSNAGTSTGALRVAELMAGTGAQIFGTPAYTNGNYFTVVIRLRDSSYAGGQNAAFLKQTSRTTNDPDYTVAAGAASRQTFGGLDTAVFGASDVTMVITDLLVWTRDLTDAEAAAVADDIRGALETGATINGTVGDGAATGSAANVALNITLAGTVGDAAATGLGASVSNSNDVFITAGVGTAAATGDAAALAINATINALIGDAVATGFAATVTNESSITTEPLINNAGSILANQAVVWTWFPGGRIGSLDLITAVDGSGTTDGDGVLQVTGLSAGPGILMVAVLNTDATDDAVYYQAGTVI